MGILERTEVNLKQYKALFIAVTVVLALLVVSPTVARVLVYPTTDYFTELYMLSSSHTAENYPYNIVSNQNYSVFLDIANHLGSCAYYVVEVKFRNDTQSGPDSLSFTSSNLPSLYNVTAFVANEATWELPITFSFNYSVNQFQANFNSMSFNGENIPLAGESSNWNSTTNVFFGNLFFELWIFNSTTGNFQYHDRYLSLLLNMTI